MLEDSYVMQDLKQYRNFPAFMQNPRIFKEYPKLVTDVLTDMFVVNGKPSRPLLETLKDCVKTVGLKHLIGDGLKGVRSL